MSVIYKGRKYQEDENGNIITNGHTQLDVDFYLSENGIERLPTCKELYGWGSTS